MTKAIVFDMDGTLNDFYGVNGWLNDLQNENPRPYEEAPQKYDIDTLNAVLNELKAVGYRIIITTWLAKDSSKAYDTLVRAAKLSWLKKYNFPYDEIHMVKYGTTKADCTRRLGGYQILVDDNDKIRQGWHLGRTIDAKQNILNELVNILESDLRAKYLTT